jgi:hypothetical protein
VKKCKLITNFFYLKLESMDTLEWGSDMENSGMYGMGAGSSCNGISGTPSGDSVHSMMVDEDYMELMTDTLFSTISCNQPLYFPDPREIGQLLLLSETLSSLQIECNS